MEKEKENIILKKAGIEEKRKLSTIFKYIWQKTFWSFGALAFLFLSILIFSVQQSRINICKKQLKNFKHELNVKTKTYRDSIKKLNKRLVEYMQQNSDCWDEYNKLKKQQNKMKENYKKSEDLRKTLEKINKLSTIRK